MELDSVIKKAIVRANEKQKSITINREISSLLKEFGPYNPLNSLVVQPNSTYEQVLKQAQDIGWS